MKRKPAGGTEKSQGNGNSRKAEAQSRPGVLPDPKTVAILAEVADLGFFQVDGDRNIVAVSPAMERITGFSEEDVLGRSCLTLIRCNECLQGCGVFSKGQVHDHRMTLYRKDGSGVEVTKSGQAIRDEEGEIVGAVETVRTLHPADALEGIGSPEMDALLGSLGRYYVVADSDMNVVAASSALPAFLGTEPEALMGMPLSELLGDDLFGEDSSFAGAVLTGERKEGWRAFLKNGLGESRSVSLTVGAIEKGIQCGGSNAALIAMIRPEEEKADVEPGGAKKGIIARSPAMQRIFRLVELLRDNDSTVLITGESGTGKEIVARALHSSSHRSSGPFVAVNCAALPGELLESELFGHVKGAFTGAVRDRPGRFELADGGTIFLDEIGDLALPLQAKLLRVLQEHSFERVGGTKTRQVDVRVIAATNANLQEAVAEHRFREDLYYRLRVVPIEIPPLRARREDLDPLIQHLLDKIGKGRGRSLRLAPSAMRALLTYAWPGNVRELENALEYATAVCEGQTIHLEDLPLEVGAAEADAYNGGVPAWNGHRVPVPGGTYLPHASGGHAAAAPPSGNGGTPAGPPAEATIPAAGTVRLTPEEVSEAESIRKALEETHYSRHKAADLLGISRTTLWRKMRLYHLD
jgi:PAS domain S-box-containing protein